jgi:hypothetical protein
MKINLGLYMNAKRGYTGSGALNAYAVRNIEQLLRLRDQAGKPLSNLNVEVRLARDRSEHRRPSDDGMDTIEEVHWRGAYEFDPLKIRGQLLTGPVGHPVTWGRAKLLTAEALESFIAKLRKRDRRAANVLVLWGHADGPRGLLFSLISEVQGRWGRDILSPLEAEHALSRTGEGLDRLKLVCMDACQGACLEFASVLMPHADYFIASQTPVPGTGWNYESWPAVLNNATADGWETAATGIADDFAASNPRGTSISVLRLDRIANVLRLLRRVTLQFRKDPAARATLLAAREAVRTYDKNLRGLVDFVALFDEAAVRLAPAGLASECHDLAGAMRGAIAVSRVSTDMSADIPMNGCSIFFPTSESAFGEPWDEITRSIYFEDSAQLALFKKTGWHELLKLMVPSVARRPPMP